MRDREEILQEMADARADLARNVSQLRDSVAAKVDVRAHAEQLLDRARDRVRSAPRLSVVLAVAIGVIAARA